MNDQTQNAPETSDKKMVRGSFAISLLVHGLILLLLGSIIIVPGVVKQMTHITAAPQPTALPPPPKLEEETPDAKADDGGGSPLSDMPDPSSTSTTQDATMDALTVASPVNAGPSMNAMSGASPVPGTFAGGKGGSGGGTGTGVGRGSGAGIGSGTRFFGSKEKLDNALVGRLYDFKQDRTHKKVTPTPDEVMKALIHSSFSSSSLSKFYVSPTPLYASHIFFPRIDATEGPAAFNVEKEVEPVNFMVHYTGLVAPPKDITMRFCGYGDDWLVVALNDRVLLDASWATSPTYDAQHNILKWKSPEPVKTLFPGASFTHGDWFEWKADDFKKMDVVWSETGGGVSSLGLFIEIKGETYQEGSDGVPLYPLFRLSAEKIDLPSDVNAHPYHPFAADGIIFKAKSSK